MFFSQRKLDEPENMEQSNEISIKRIIFKNEMAAIYLNYLI